MRNRDEGNLAFRDAGRLGQRGTPSRDGGPLSAEPPHFVSSLRRMSPRALKLPESVASRVGEGLPVLRLDALSADRSGLSGGDLVHLTDSRSEVLGSAVADPENGLLRILSRRRVDTFDGPFLERRLREAIERRQALGLPGEGTTIYRLLNAEGDGLSGFTADVVGEYVVLYVYSRGLLELGRLLGQRILEFLPARGIVLKVRSRTAHPGKMKEEILGTSPPGQSLVVECGIPYEVHPLGSLDVGLFTDMREHRRRLGHCVEGLRVLNLFAYTGSLSVVAALGGAGSVTSVDLSPGVLEWAKKNFRLSGLDPEEPRFRFEAADAPRFVRQELARAAQYDLVILDPPAVSTARPSSWSMKSDYPDLISEAAQLVAATGGGLLWLTSNVRGRRHLMRHVESGMQASGRPFTVTGTGGLPADYPVPESYPMGRYLEVVHLRVQ